LHLIQYVLKIIDGTYCDASQDEIQPYPVQLTYQPAVENQPAVEQHSTPPGMIFVAVSNITITKLNTNNYYSLNDNDVNIQYSFYC